MTENFLGSDNLYTNAVLNCIEILKKFPDETGRSIKEYYTEDVMNPITPSFSVIVSGSEDIMRATQNMSRIRYTVQIPLDVWYFHCDLTSEVKRNEITYILWEVNKLFKKYITLNGFASKLGTETTGVRWVPQVRGNRILAGGVVHLLVKALHTTTTTH